MSLPSFLRDLLWEPGYDDCCICSVPAVQVPALYEAWWALHDEMLLGHMNQPLPPHAVRHAMCAACTASAVEEKASSALNGMTLLVVRTLR